MPKSTSTNYFANPKLKGEGVSQGLTLQQLGEFQKCFLDPVYFVRNYVKIVHVDRGEIFFDLWPFQEQMIRNFVKHRFNIVKMPRQIGKSLDQATPILTTRGWKTMGDIQTGDFVYGSNGTPIQVTEAHDTLFNRECFEITFDNQETIIADGEHLWTVYNPDWRKQRPKTLTTKKLSEILDQKQKNGSGIRIPLSPGIEFDEVDNINILPIDPYVLGVWLGDGSKHNSDYTGARIDAFEINEHIKSKGYTTSDFKQKTFTEAEAGIYSVTGLKATLKENNLLFNKHIPEIYLRTSRENRLELLRGLMDTDGSCTNHNGVCEFYQKCRKITYSVRELLSSLGIKNTVSEKIIDNQIYHTVRFSTKEIVFHLQRKIERQARTQGQRTIKNVYIQSIIPVESVPVRCISVDAEDHLYLVGKTFIPTHNSVTTCSYILWLILFHENQNIAILANKLKTSSKLLNDLKKSYMLLPKWIQQGVVEWNKGSIELENGCKIMASSTSSDAIRGNAFNCLTGDAKVTILDSLGESKKITLTELREQLLLSTKTNNCSYIPNKLNFQVLTNKGFKPFFGLTESIPKFLLSLYFDDETYLECTLNHKILGKNNVFVTANKLKISDEVQTTTNGFKKLIYKEKSKNYQNKKVHDLLNVADTQSYIASDVINHNCIFLDEFAFVPPHIADEFFDSVYPTITSGETTKVIIVSCVSKDTYIITNKGIQQVKDLIQNDQIPNGQIGYKVEPYSVMGAQGFNQGQYMVNSGIAKTRKFRTAMSNLECSLDHKLWACKDGEYGWFKSCDLSVNDYVSIRYGDNIWANNDSLEDIKLSYSNMEHNRFQVPDKITQNLAYFMGLYLAEGYSRYLIRKGKIVGGQVTVTCGDNIMNELNAIGLDFSTYDNLHYTASSKSLVSFLDQFGFNISLKANKKVIPKRLFSCSKEVVGAFLKGFFDGDGCIKKRKGDISVVSSSEELISQIRILLMNMGIFTQYYTGVTPPTDKVKVESTYYRLELCSYTDKNNFMKYVGFGLPRKLIRQNLIILTSTKHTKDIIPFARTLLEKNEIKFKDVATLSNHKSREVCLEIDNIEQQLSHIISKNIRWSKILEITEGENEVFDFSLEDIEGNDWCHSVAYNGIIGHQTPKGLNKFHKMWVEANNPRNSKDKTVNWNGYEPFSVNWRQVPKPNGKGLRDDAWKAETIARTSISQFSQEFESIFGDVYITLKDKKTGEIIEASVEELYNRFKIETTS